MAQRKRVAQKKGKVTINVHVPDLTVKKAVALDLPHKVKSKVLYSLIKKALDRGDPNWGETCDETWGEVPQISTD